MKGPKTSSMLYPLFSIMWSLPSPLFLLLFPLLLTPIRPRGLETVGPSGSFLSPILLVCFIFLSSHLLPPLPTPSRHTSSSHPPHSLHSLPVFPLPIKKSSSSIPFPLHWHHVLNGSHRHRRSTVMALAPACLPGWLNVYERMGGFIRILCTP